MTFDEKLSIFLVNATSGCQGVYNIKVLASDMFNGQDSLIFSITVTNKIPECKTLNDSFKADFSIGINYTVPIPENICEDPDNDDLTYKILLENGKILPSWIEFKTIEMNIYIIPKSKSQGIHKLKLVSEDSYGGLSFSLFQIMVINSPPKGKALPNQVTFVGKDFEYKVINLLDVFF